MKRGYARTQTTIIGLLCDEVENVQTMHGLAEGRALAYVNILDLCDELELRKLGDSILEDDEFYPY